jgi:lysophospholipase L1-like esterase
MTAFVCDYDHNAPDAEHLEKTHYKMYEKIRAAHPDIPYIIISKPDFDSNYVTSIPRRNVIFDTYRRARDNGDLNVYYIDGAGIFRGPYEDSCTVDGTHPNDLGFALMADAIEAELKRAFTQNNIL